MDVPLHRPQRTKTKASCALQGEKQYSQVLQITGFPKLTSMLNYWLLRCLTEPARDRQLTAMQHGNPSQHEAGWLHWYRAQGQGVTYAVRRSSVGTSAAMPIAPRVAGPI
ncbi:hypothetical protein ElyMa_004822900 [Elysia marginata]|uniref:Uncharacterized protein n=1 Tax=Elysia marginata TaxID=1093978 RepID=A0AAV4INF5_9GAST|nr:hypothetical protein ElyMa_004822900 [Elysia marginata]